MKFSYIFIFFAFIFTSTQAFSANGIRVTLKDCKLIGGAKVCNNSKQGYAYNYYNKSRIDWSFTPAYKAIYDLKVIPPETSCENAKPSDTTTLPRGTLFRESFNSDTGNQGEFIVDIHRINSSKSHLLSNPYKVCKDITRRERYLRVGGLNTGLLVVPFKIRGNDLYSDSMIGPYLSYKWERFELLTSLGASQISFSEITDTKIEDDGSITASAESVSKTGLTFSVGTSVEITKDFDVAFLVGKDWLSGSAGEQWEYQGDTWFSIAIGWNFTRDR